jgi:hypothetical protein
MGQSLVLVTLTRTSRRGLQVLEADLYRCVDLRGTRERVYLSSRF